MPRSKTRKKPPSTLNPALLDQLLTGVDPTTQLLGPDGLLKQLTAALVERALQAELTAHLGYEQGQRRPADKTNGRNGSSAKTLLTDQGEVPVAIPRDREGSFEPVLVKKHQRRLEGFDDKVLSLYSRGMSTRDIKGHLEELYGTEVSPDLISRVTDAVLDEVQTWRNRSLAALWPVVYVDCLFAKVRHQGIVQTRAVYVALGIDAEGCKQVLGLWSDESEGARFWMKVLGELKQRGVDDILIACCDGLKGLPEAIEAVFPRAIVQTCIVHVTRSSTEQVSWEDRKEVTQDLKSIYQAVNEEGALVALSAFEQKWDGRYPSVSRSWRSNWNRIAPFFEFPAEIRRIIYTTNAIEGTNRQLRKVLKTRGLFPSEPSLFKVLYLAIRRLTGKWSNPVAHWQRARQQFAIYFGDRFPL